MIDDEIESLHIVSLRVSIPVGLVASRRWKFKSRPRETLWGEIAVAAGRAAAVRRIAGWLQVNRRLAGPVLVSKSQPANALGKQHSRFINGIRDFRAKCTGYGCFPGASYF